MRQVTRRSAAEATVVTWLENEGFSVWTNVRSLIKLPNKHKAEIDIYIPSIKFGIEVDGEHWHREQPGLSFSKYEFMRKYGCLEEGVKWDGYAQYKDEQMSRLGAYLLHVSAEDVRDFPEQTRSKILMEIDQWKTFLGGDVCES